MSPSPIMLSVHPSSQRPIEKHLNKSRQFPKTSKTRIPDVEKRVYHDNVTPRAHDNHAV